jgi:hypothetical protein
MPPINILFKPSKNPQAAMRKSTRRVLKTARAQQAEPELEDEDHAPAKTPAYDAEDIYVNDEEEATFKRREEEEESEGDYEEDEAVGDHGDEEEEQPEQDEDELEDEPETVQVVPQKRKNGKDTNKPTSKLFRAIRVHFSSKLSSERVNRRELEEVVLVETRKITYNITIFSLAELAKPQARREPAARFLVLPSNLEWPDIHAQLKIKAGDVLYAGQAAIADNAYEMTFCIACYVSNPLPLSCIADYNHLVENALRQQQPTVKVIIKATPQVCQ